MPPKTIVAPAVDSIQYGEPKKMDATGGTLYRFNPSPISIKLGCDAVPDSLLVASWYASQSTQGNDPCAYYFSVELCDSDQIKFFEDLDAKNKKFIAEAGPVAYPRKGPGSDHAERYKPMMWTRDRDGCKMLTVNCVVPNDDEEEDDTRKKKSPTLFYKSKLISELKPGERLGVPKQASISAIEKGTRVIIAAEALWLFYNGANATAKWHAKSVMVFAASTATEEDGGMSLLSEEHVARMKEEEGQEEEEPAE